MTVTVTTPPETAIIDGVLTPGDRIPAEYLTVPDACAGHEVVLAGVCDIDGCDGRHCNSPEEHACGGCGGFFCPEHLGPHTDWACPDCDPDGD